MCVGTQSREQLVIGNWSLQLLCIRRLAFVGRKFRRVSKAISSTVLAGIYDSGELRRWRQYHEMWNECCHVHPSPVGCLGSHAAVVSSIHGIWTVLLPQISLVLSCPGGPYFPAQRVSVPTLLCIVVGRAACPSLGRCFLRS